LVVGGRSTVGHAVASSEQAAERSDCGVFAADEIDGSPPFAWGVEGSGRVIAALLNAGYLRLKLHNGRVVVA
jgi:hypothetical protein